MLHWLHFRQHRAVPWTPLPTRNVTFSNGKRIFMKLRSHDDIAFFAQMLHWLHFRQQRASLWIPCSTQNVTFSKGKTYICETEVAQMLRWLYFRHSEPLCGLLSLLQSLLAPVFHHCWAALPVYMFPAGREKPSW